jgi:hypothetical protein
MTLGLIQPLTEMSARNIFWCVGLTNLHLHMPVALKSGLLILLEPSGPVRDCNGIALHVTYNLRRII